MTIDPEERANSFKPLVFIVTAVFLVLTIFHSLHEVITTANSDSPWFYFWTVILGVATSVLVWAVQ